MKLIKPSLNGGNVKIVGLLFQFYVHIPGTLYIIPSYFRFLFNSILCHSITQW